MQQSEINKQAIKSGSLAALVIIILVSFAGNAFLGFKNIQIQKDLQSTKADLDAKNNSINIINFTRMLVKDVLSAEKEVNFETRLQLENAVRDLNDEEILVQWKKFTDSGLEEQAQIEVKKLLRMLLDKAVGA